VVDLLRDHHREGRRFMPTELVESGPRVAVELAVTDPRWAGTGRTYKVFTFREPDGRAVLLEDCRDRGDALAKLAV
jgi:hypothetical protein